MRVCRVLSVYIANRNTIGHRAFSGKLQPAGLIRHLMYVLSRADGTRCTMYLASRPRAHCAASSSTVPVPSRVCSMNAADADARPGCRTPVGCSFTVRGAIRNSVSLARCSISLPLGNMLGKHDAATITMSCHCDQRVVGVEHIAGRAFATSLIQRKQGF